MNRDYNVSDIAFKISSLAMQSILYEAACFPSPGLISPVSDGANKDVDYFMVLDKTASLLKPLILCTQAGLAEDSCEAVFKEVINIIDKIDNIEGYKERLLLISIGCAAAGKAVHDKNNFKSIREFIMNMNSSIKDVSIVFNFSIDFYKECKELYINDRLIHTLIGIMQYCEDNTILLKHSSEVLKEIQAKAKFIIGLGGMKTDFGVDAIYHLDKELKRRGIAPDGSADLLSLTVFLNSIENYINKL